MKLKWDFKAIFLALVVVSCSHIPKSDTTFGNESVEQDLLARMPLNEISYEREVKPILKNRCAVCHGCYDAPCQLKLNSYAGITRGVNPEKVYDGARISRMEPTRLFIDAQNDRQWRQRGFRAVINEKRSTSPAENLENSPFYKMLRLKQKNPQPQTGRISEDLDTGLDREQICASNEEFDEFALEHPAWGMPFGFPNLKQDEYKTLVFWLAQGSKAQSKPQLPGKLLGEVRVWEKFLNGTSLKERLVSRYIYEHLFLSHIHFKGSSARRFFRLVRSKTPSGQAVEEIPTLRPYDDPNQKFFYRLTPYQPTIVSKDHVVYELSPQKMERYRELFFKPKYQVTYWPRYGSEFGSNPFAIFEQLPVKSRYKFLLDDARFYIEGFVKGPVCRGQVALNVIEDQFWVFFFDPDQEISSIQPGFLSSQVNELRLPAAKADELNFLSIWSEYWKQQTRYLSHKVDYFRKIHEGDSKQALGFIWNGQGKNPNAALTVFRHFDSASVKFGLVGDYPETAWVLDYPLLERVHYLLVAGFDVYGNLSHQLNTRLYMDFLRMEAEDQFLSYIPVAQRNKIRTSWYQGIRSNIDWVFDQPKGWVNDQSALISRASKNPQMELYQHFEKHLGPIASKKAELNRCYGEACSRKHSSSFEAKVDKVMEKISRVKGVKLRHLPEVTFLRVRSAKQDLAYTLIHNKAYKSVSFMLADESIREDLDRENDTLTVIKGLEGSYPNFFLVVEESELEIFATAFVGMSGESDYLQITKRYGVRRTNPDFWLHSDWFAQSSSRADPVGSGVFDLNRYQIY